MSVHSDPAASGVRESAMRKRWDLIGCVTDPRLFEDLRSTRLVTPLSLLYEQHMGVAKLLDALEEALGGWEVALLSKSVDSDAAFVEVARLRKLLIELERQL